MNASSQTSFVLPEHYLEIELHSPYKNEYLDGEVRAMGYTSNHHGLIVGGIMLALGNCFRKKGCKLYPADRLIHSESCNLFAYPDLVILCEPPQFKTYRGDMQALLNPTILIEVLSETTAEFDRTRKLPYYRQIQSVQHILFVESERKLVEHHQRVQLNQWLVSELSPPHRLTLNDCTIDINAFYDQVNF